MIFKGFVLLGALVLLVTILERYQAKDLNEDYVKVPAFIQSLDKKCTFKRGDERILDKNNLLKLLRVDCAMAPAVAQHHGFTKENITAHIEFTYEYVSPVDHNHYKATHKLEWPFDRSKTLFQTKKIYVFAHKKEPARSRLPLKNRQFDEAEFGF